VVPVLAVLIAPVPARAADAPAAKAKPTKTKAAKAKPANAKPAGPKVVTKADPKADNPKADKKKGGKGKGKGKSTAEEAADAKLVRKIRGTTLTVTADGEVKTINEDAKIEAFPTQASAHKKAFAQMRRDELGDAERSARAAKEDDRWWTVLFHLRSLDSRADAEACFWRAIAFYRMGELSRARNTRQYCETEAALGDEDALSASLQPPSALPEMAQPGDPKPVPVANLSPYAGPGPTKFER